MTDPQGSTPTPDEPGTLGVCTNGECSEFGLLKALGSFAPEEIQCGSCGGPISVASNQDGTPGEADDPPPEASPDAG